MQLLWSPFRDDEFILYGNSILFYRISSFDSTLSTVVIFANISTRQNVKSLLFKTEIVLTVTLCPKTHTQSLLAQLAITRIKSYYHGILALK